MRQNPAPIFFIIFQKFESLFLAEKVDVNHSDTDTHVARRLQILIYGPELMTNRTICVKTQRRYCL